MEVEQENSQETTDNSSEVSINWESVEIPFEVLREHPDYKKLLDENIKRRKEAKELKAQLKAPESEVTEPVPTFDVESLASNIGEKLMQGINERLQRLESVAKSVEQRDAEVRINDLSSKYNLSSDDREFLRQLPEGQQEAFAKRVGHKVNDSSMSSDGGEANRKNRLIDRLNSGRDIIEDPKQVRAFSPEMHKQKDGGPVVNS